MPWTVPLWPVMEPGKLLTVAAAAEWEAARGGPQTTSNADHAAARARQNDFIVPAMDYRRPILRSGLFHPQYEMNGMLRNILSTRYIRDLKRAVRECREHATAHS